MAVSPHMSTETVDRSGASRTVNTLLWSVCRPKRPDTPESGVQRTAVFFPSAPPPFVVGAKSASGGTPLRVFLPPLPCASSPHKSQGFCGGPKGNEPPPFARRWANRLLCSSVLLLRLYQNRRLLSKGAPCRGFPLDKAAGFSIMNTEGRRCMAVSPHMSTETVDRSGASRTVNTLLWSVCRPKRPDTPESGVQRTAVFFPSASPPFSREWLTAFLCSSVLQLPSYQNRRLLSKGAPCREFPLDKAAGFSIMNIEGRRRMAVSPTRSTYKMLTVRVAAGRSTRFYG